ncbi:MAG: pilus assembly protein N-terminal domain-containing protein [Planctomycetes bacterium]|nr:pilus assembly protein N-terminal domain-containing protein [Planctomycetota bacterium]
MPYGSNTRETPRRRLMVAIAAAWALFCPLAPARAQDELIESIVEPDVELHVVSSRSRIVKLRHDLVRASVADPAVCEVVAFGTRQIEIVGRSPGMTTLTLWTRGSAEPEPHSLTLRVVPPGEPPADRTDAIRRRLHERLPGATLELTVLRDKLFVRGRPRDADEARQWLGTVREVAAQKHDSHEGGLMVVDLLEVAVAPQVVVTADVLAVDAHAMAASDRKEGTGTFSSFLKSSGTAASGVYDSSAAALMTEALIDAGLARRLAQPRLVVLSGRTASAEFAVRPSVHAPADSVADTVLRLELTPTAIAPSRVQLEFAPAAGAASLPGTTVELPAGACLAVSAPLPTPTAHAGAIQRALQAAPLLGGIARADRTPGLLIILRAELAEPHQAPQREASLREEFRRLSQPQSSSPFYEDPAESEVRPASNAKAAQSPVPAAVRSQFELERRFLLGPHGLTP